MRGVERFITTVDAVEELTRLDFFSRLQDDLEESLESTSGGDWYATW